MSYFSISEVALLDIVEQCIFTFQIFEEVCLNKALLCLKKKQHGIHRGRRNGVISLSPSDERGRCSLLMLYFSLTGTLFLQSVLY